MSNQEESKIRIQDIDIGQNRIMSMGPGRDLQIYHGLMEASLGYGFPTEDFRGLIAFAGAGGKTTSMLNLAAELHRRGHRVLVMTTTHMQAFRPESVLTDDPEDILAKLEAEGICIAGTAAGDWGMRAISDETYQAVKDSFDYILYEADGARRHPLKTPAEYEPVFLESTDFLYVSLGLSCIGRRLEDACHRFERLKLNGKTLVTPDLAAKIMKQGYDRFPYRKCYILNQTDSDHHVRAAVQMAKILNPVLMTSYGPENRNPY